MSEEPRKRRAYRSRVREDRAAKTRAAVIAAARKSFIRDGWQATTIAAVAGAAGVSAESVYAIFGNKTQLLLAVVQAAVRRSEPDTPLVEQAGPQAVASAPDQATALRLFAEDITRVLSAVADMVAVVRVAAQADPAVEGVYRTIHSGRRENLRVFARALSGKGPLRGSLSEDDVLDEVWRLASPELFLLMTRTEGLSLPAYARWLECTLGRLLLPETQERLSAPGGETIL